MPKEDNEPRPRPHVVVPFLGGGYSTAVVHQSSALRADDESTLHFFRRSAMIIFVRLVRPRHRQGLADISENRVACFDECGRV